MSKNIDQIANEIQAQLRDEGLSGEVFVVANLPFIMEGKDLILANSAEGRESKFFSYQLNPC